MLTMRDFLIEKLRGAEIALKASMTEATALKGQADADQEVCDRPAWGSALNRLRDLCCELIVPYSLSSSFLAFHPHLSSFLSPDNKLSGSEESRTGREERRSLIEV